MQLRAVVAAQAGQRTAEFAPTNRENYLLSLRVPSAWGDFRLELERQANHAPFVFGTAYINGRFEFDKPYVSPQSQALRIYERQAFYWQKQFGAETQMIVSAQQAQVSRRETLVGFWDIKNTSQLNGYWRELDASARQKDVDFNISSAATFGGLRHHFTFAAQQHQQSLNFSGPQSISQFAINIANPVWPINLSTLTLRPRTLQESYKETGFAATDRIELGSGFEVRLGARRSTVEITTASNTPVPTTASKFAHTTYAGALAWQMSPVYRAWLANTASFEPNRGLLSSGGFLPPQYGRQIDAGLAFSNGLQRWSASVFNIQQTNLPNTDPLDKNFIVPAGSARVSDIVLSGGGKFGDLTIDANATFQRGRAADLTSPAQGKLSVGQPSWLGGARIEGRISNSVTWWVNPQWRGPRPADATGSLYAPAYIRWDAGIKHQIAPHTTLAVQLDNITDKRYVQAINSDDNVWQGPRRRMVVQLTQNF